MARLNFLPRQTPVGWSPVTGDKTPEYDSWDIATAASSMTASGVALSKLQPLELDKDMKDYFGAYMHVDDPLKVRDQNWQATRIDSIKGYVPSLQKEREDKFLPRMSNKEIRFLMESESFEEMVRKKTQLDRLAHANAVFEENPFAVMGSAFGLSMLEPWNVASWPIALVKASSRAASAARLAAVGGGIAAAEEVVLSQDDPNRTIGISAASVGIATVINGAIGGYLSRSKAIQESQLDEIKKLIDSIDNEADVVIDLEKTTPVKGASDEAININLVEDVRELNKVLDDIELTPKQKREVARIKRKNKKLTNFLRRGGERVPPESSRFTPILTMLRRRKGAGGVHPDSDLGRILRESGIDPKLPKWRSLFHQEGTFNDVDELAQLIEDVKFGDGAYADLDWSPVWNADPNDPTALRDFVIDLITEESMGQGPYKPSAVRRVSRSMPDDLDEMEELFARLKIDIDEMDDDEIARILWKQSLEETGETVPELGEKILSLRDRAPGGKINEIRELLEADLEPEMIARISRVIDSGRVSAVTGQTAALATGKDTLEIAGAYGLEKIAAISSPLVRLLRSPFPEVRRAAVDLLDTPFLTSDNLKGIPSLPALEAKIGANRKLYNDLIDDLEAAYYKYLFPDGEGGDFARGRGGRTFRQVGQLARNVATGNIAQLKRNPATPEGKMSFDHFKMKALQHHTGSIESTDEAIIAAAKGIKKFFSTKEDEANWLVKQIASQKNKDVTWVEGVNYTHRIYNKRFVAENPEAFEEFLFGQLRKKYGDTKNIEIEFGTSVDNIRNSFRVAIDKIAKSPEERIKLEEVFDPIKRGASHNRYWDFVDDADLYLTDFVVKDVEALSNSYVTNILADAAFMRHFGTLNTNSIIDTMRDSLRRRHGNQEPILDKQGNITGYKWDGKPLDPDMEAALSIDLDLYKAMLQRVRGIYLDANSPVPGGVIQGTLDNVKKYNNLRLGAGFMIQSLPDIGRQVMYLGFGQAFGPILKAYAGRNAKALEAFGKASRELKVLNVANEINHSSITNTMTNTSVNSFAKNKFTDVLNKNNNAMFILNGLALWNDLLKKNAGIGVVDQIIQNAKLAQKGELSGEKLSNMSKLGLDEDALKRILVEFEEHGESFDGVHLLNFENWSEEAMERSAETGLSLADIVQLAVKKEVDTIVVTPGIGDIPLIMENSWMSLFAQYKSFPIAAIVRQTIPLAQNMNNRALAGLAVSMGAAFVASQTMAYARGQEYGEKSWTSILWNSLESTGNLSTIGEFTNYAQQLATGNPMWLGPSGTIIPDALKVQAGLANENGMNPYEQRAAQRLMPWAGLVQILSALPREGYETSSEIIKELENGL